MLFESVRWWDYASRLDGVINELINYEVILSRRSINNIDINTPKRIGSDIALWVDEILKVQDVIYPKNSPLQKTEVINNVVNIWLNKEYALSVLLSDFKAAPKSIGFQSSFKYTDSVAIEHTSLNTVFPLNLATFRGSVIGDTAKLYLSRWGANAKSHFFVEDLSQRNHVLLTGAKNCNISAEQVRNLKGKLDHEIGYLYASTVIAVKRPGLDAKDMLSKMFPKAISRLVVEKCGGFETFHWSEYASDELFTAFRDSCIKGFEETLQFCNIKIDSYDNEYDVYNRCNGNEPEFFSSSPSPLERNICYFAYLASQYDLVLSILPSNLIYHPNYKDSLIGRLTSELQAKSIMPDPNKKFFFYPYGKIEILADDGLTLESDSISEGRFTSLDSYLEDFGRTNQVNIIDVVNSLRLTFLGQSKNSSTLILDTNLQEKRVYFDIIDVLEEMVEIVNNQEIRYSSDNKWSDAEKKLLINLLSFEKYTIQQLHQIPEFGKLIKVAQVTTQHIKKIIYNSRYLGVLYFNQKALVIIAAYCILNVFEALGIYSLEGSVLSEFQQKINQIKL